MERAQTMKILEEIVENDGKCNSLIRCAICPFRVQCTLAYLNKGLKIRAVVLPQHRKQAALNSIASMELFDDEPSW